MHAGVAGAGRESLRVKPALDERAQVRERDDAVVEAPVGVGQPSEHGHHRATRAQLTGAQGIVGTGDGVVCVEERHERPQVIGHGSLAGERCQFVGGVQDRAGGARGALGPAIARIGLRPVLRQLPERNRVAQI